MSTKDLRENREVFVRDMSVEWYVFSCHSVHYTLILSIQTYLVWMLFLLCKKNGGVIFD